MYDFDSMMRSLYERNPQASAFHAQQRAILEDNAYQRKSLVVSDSMTIFIPVAPTSNAALLKQIISNLKKCKKHGRFKQKSIQAENWRCYTPQ